MQLRCTITMIYLILEKPWYCTKPFTAIWYCRLQPVVYFIPFRGLAAKRYLHMYMNKHVVYRNVMQMLTERCSMSPGQVWLKVFLNIAYSGLIALIYCSYLPHLDLQSYNNYHTTSGYYGMLSIN